METGSGGLYGEGVPAGDREYASAAVGHPCRHDEVVSIRKDEYDGQRRGNG